MNPRVSAAPVPLFHGNDMNSFGHPVESLWNVCRSRIQSSSWSRISDSHTFGGTSFANVSFGDSQSRHQLGWISTFAQTLLLLLVLMVFLLI